MFLQETKNGARSPGAGTESVWCPGFKHFVTLFGPCSVVPHFLSFVLVQLKIPVDRSFVLPYFADFPTGHPMLNVFIVHVRNGHREVAA